MDEQIIDVNTKLFKNYTVVLLGTGVGRALSFFISVILARLLDKEGFGLYSLFFTVMILAWQLPQVIDSTYVRYAKAEASTDKIDYLRTSFFIKGILVLSLLISAYPLSYLLAHHIFNKPDSVFFLTAAIVVGALLSLFSTLAAIYQAEESFIKFSLINILFYLGVVLTFCIYIICRFNLTVSVAVWINTIMASIAGILGIGLVYKRIKYITPVHMGLFFNMFHFTKWLLAANLAYILAQRIDILVLAKYVGYDTLGVYAVAVRIAMIAALFTASVSIVLLPRGSQALKSPQHMRAYIKESFIMIFILSFIIGIIIAISPFLIKVLFGTRYLGALLLTRILLIVPIFTVLYTPFSYLFYAENKSKKIFELGLVILIAAISALIFSVPRYGSLGAAASIVFSSFCGFIFIFFRTFSTIKKTYENL